MSKAKQAKNRDDVVQKITVPTHRISFVRNELKMLSLDLWSILMDKETPAIMRLAAKHMEQRVTTAERSLGELVGTLYGGGIGDVQALKPGKPK